MRVPRNEIVYRQALPGGWLKTIKKRRKSKRPRFDAFLYPPKGNRIRTAIELMNFLAKNPELCPDFNPYLINLETKIGNGQNPNYSTRRLASFLHYVKSGFSCDAARVMVLGDKSKVKTVRDGAKERKDQIVFICTECTASFPSHLKLKTHVDSLHKVATKIENDDSSEKKEKLLPMDQIISKDLQFNLPDEMQYEPFDVPVRPYFGHEWPAEVLESIPTDALESVMSMVSYSCISCNATFNSHYELLVHRCDKN